MIVAGGLFAGYARFHEEVQFLDVCEHAYLASVQAFAQQRGVVRRGKCAVVGFEALAESDDATALRIELRCGGGCLRLPMRGELCPRKGR